MNRRVESLSKDKLRALAERDDTIVMEARHDNVFEPWDSKRIHDIVATLSCITMSEKEKTKVQLEEELRADVRFTEFSRLFPVFFSKLCDVSVVGNEKHMDVIRFMLTTQKTYLERNISEQQAMKNVADFALNSLVQQTEEQRVQEVDPE
jgi:hypothetical protein